MSEVEQVLNSISEIKDRLEKLEGETADTGTYGQRLHKFKTEITSKMQEHKSDISEMLKRHNEQRTELEANFEANFNQLAGTLQEYATGLNRAEARLNMIWNTFNALVRMIERVWSGTDDVPLTREVFEDMFKKAGRQVFEEALAHEKSELARMRQEKASGMSVSPMKPRTATVADAVFTDQAKLITSSMEANKSDLVELACLRAEADAVKRAEPEVVITNHMQEQGPVDGEPEHT